MIISFRKDFSPLAAEKNEGHKKNVIIGDNIFDICF
jgi:hypothetical protein